MLQIVIKCLCSNICAGSILTGCPNYVVKLLMDYINIKGARTHNLKNIDVEIPNKLIVITDLSGSGKSTLSI